jgi:hypothetical protein
MDTLVIYIVGIVSALCFFLLFFTILKKSSKNITTLSQNPVLRGERGRKQQVYLVLLIVVALVVVELVS